MGLIDTLKDAASLVQKADNIDLYRILLQVQQDALNLVQEKAALVEEVQTLRSQLRELEILANTKAAMVRRDGKYFVEGDGEPYCPNCWETEQLAIHLATYQNQPGYFCRKCRSGVR